MKAAQLEALIKGLVEAEVEAAMFVFNEAGSVEESGIKRVEAVMFIIGSGSSSQKGMIFGQLEAEVKTFLSYFLRKQMKLKFFSKFGSVSGRGG